MTITNCISIGDFRIHQFDAKEFTTMCDAENILLKVANSYEEGTILMNPNTGEVIMVDELRRAASLLDFLSTTRVVELNP